MAFYSGDVQQKRVKGKSFMFDSLQKKKQKKEEISSFLEIIEANTAKLTISKFAIEKAVGMISKYDTPKSRIYCTKERRKKKMKYIELNVQPNDNETGTDFWRNCNQKI